MVRVDKTMVKVNKNLFYVFIAVGATILVIFLLLFLSTLQGERGTLEGKQETVVNQPVVNSVKVSQETNKNSLEPQTEYNVTMATSEMLADRIVGFIPIMFVLGVFGSIFPIFINIYFRKKRGRR